MKFKRTLKKEARLLENKRSSFFEDERCRKIMEAFVDKEVELEIQDLTEEEFPIAFVIHEHAEIYEGVESRDEFTRQNYKGYQLYEEEIRAYNGILYKPVRVSRGVAISTVFEKNPNRAIHFRGAGYNLHQEDCEHYKAFDGKIWKETREPHYWLTEECMLIQYRAFDGNRLPANHFSALDREVILPLVKNEVSREAYIEVRMPEMVKLYRPK